MNEYRGKHAPSQPWPVASNALIRSGKGRHRKKNRRRRALMWIAVVFLLLLFSYPLIEAKLILTTDIRSFSFDDLPSDANHLRIVYVTDIHWGFWFSDADLDRLISQINNLRPDIVLFGGDYATDDASAIEFFHLVQRFKDQEGKQIHRRYGVFGVIGDTDVGDSGFTRSELIDAMKNAGITPLINEVKSINIGSGQIYIAGVDPVTPDLKYLAGIVSPSDFVIFLAHNPKLIRSAQQTTTSAGSVGWFDLGLFGHTHGGQMVFFSDLLDIAPDVPDRYRSGWFTENRSMILVSRGIGTSVVPFRLFCFPQIHLIELTHN